ncbi:MAG: ABC transporter ATP-binding protein [Burkholderiales bacterium]|nr:ABC transporter ATP-binding protein [Burkholderiales bacterium]
MNRAAPPKIEVLRVTKQFGGTAAQPVLRDIDLACAENEFVCLLGRSGCGKTTLLNIIAGLLLPTSGEVRVDGDRVTGPGRGKGMVFQQNALFPWLSARGNIEFGARRSGLDKAGAGRVADELLDLVGLREFGGRYPGQLSGGMQQRVAIARALALDPHIMLMDEPFGALDEITRLDMQAELLRVWASRRKTVVFVTHSIMEALTLADRVVVMGGGGIAAIHEVATPRPRSRSDPDLLRLHEAIWQGLH